MAGLNIVFMGTPDMARPSLAEAHAAGHKVQLVITQPDRKAGRGRKIVRGQVAALADELGLPVSQPQSVTDMAGELAALAPDALVVLAFGQILCRSILDIPRLGAVNVHFSLLPLLRGAAPIQRAVLQGHQQTGVTTMYMAEGLDSGDIMEQRATAIGPQETAGELGERLAQMGADLLVGTLEAMAGGNPPRAPQDHERATWAPRLSKAEGLVDWSRPAAELDWHVRGMDPWPGAYTTLQGQPLKLFAPTALLPGETDLPPGSLLAHAPGGMLAVACGRGALGVGQVQAPGKRRALACDFLRGARLEPGEILGQ